MTTPTSLISSEIDFNREGRQTGFLRLPHSVHRSAYGWIPIPVACIRNGGGPRVLLVAGNHGGEYEGQIAFGSLLRELAVFERDGTVLCKRVPCRTERGDCVFHLGTPFEA